MKPMYGKEGVLLLFVSIYNYPSQTEHGIYIIGYDSKHSECSVVQISRTSNLISGATFDKGDITFSFSISTVIVRVIYER